MTAAQIPLHGLPSLAERTIRGLDIIAQAPRSSPLVAGYCGTSSLIVLGGPPGSVKTFLGIDLGLSVGSGRPFHGRDVLSGPVLFIVAEGAGGFGPRVDAWVDANPGDISAVTWLLGAVPLADRAAVAELRELVVYLAPAMIIFDTFARCTPGVDENSARDMGVVLSHLDALREVSGAAILLVHHIGKDAGRGLRGSSALTGAADTILLTQRTRTGATVTVSKQKDGVDSQVERFRLDPRRDSAVLVLEEATTEPFRPTVLMARISTFLETCREPLSARQLMAHVTGNNEAKLIALRALVDDGFVQRTNGTRGALHTLVRPFHEMPR
jgi:RecA-family ATPase